MNEFSTVASPLMDHDTTILIIPNQQNTPSSINNNICGIAASAWSMSINPLMAAAAPLLYEAYQLRHAGQLQPRQIRHQLQTAVQTLEQKLAMLACSADQILAIRYVICCLLDEMITHTHWGETWWAQRSLLIHFYHEAWGGEKFFLLLEKLQQRPQEQLPLLILIHCILCLGFEGRYRVETQGAQQLLHIRQQLADTLKTEHTDPLKTQLSPTGASQLHAGQPEKPIGKKTWWWTTVVVLLLIAYTTAAISLHHRSTAIARQISSTIRHDKSLIQPHDPSTLQLNRLFKQELTQGDLKIYTLSGREIVVLQGDAVFNTGSAQMSPRFIQLLQKLAAVLSKTEHHILVEGHTDNQPFQQADYQSNQALSQARAEAAAQVLLDTLRQPKRIESQGRADSQPQNSNQTTAGRALNRRVEITLTPPQINL